MPTTRPRSLLLCAGLCLLLGAPAPAQAARPIVARPRPGSRRVAPAKAPSTALAAATVAAAKSSPKLRRTLKRKDLKKNGLQTLQVAPGVKMDFGAYVAQTALDRRPQLRPLFRAKVRKGLLDRAPTYTETIYELEDRLVVDRILVVPLSAGACDKPSLPRAVASLCFTRDPKNKASAAVNRDLAKLRAALGKRSDKEIAQGSVTVGAAKAMNDAQLLDLLLNTDARTIRQVSILPRRVAAGGKITPILHHLDQALPASADTGLSPAPSGSPSRPNLPGPFYEDRTFPTEYFLTGFTLGHEISDSWEYTIADASWWHGRYYIELDYHLGLGLGLREPFSVDVKSKATGSDRRQVVMSVAPVNVDAQGKPAYPAVGLPGNQTFGGKEFVLEFDASCHLDIGIPGPDIHESCPTIGKNLSRDIDPVIGTDTSKIADWWLKGTDTGLAIDVTVAKASLDLGLDASITNGTIGMAVSPLTSSSLAGISGGRVSLASRDPFTFNVNRSQKTDQAGFRLDDPRYGFDVRFTPELRVQVGIDVSIYSHDWTLGPYGIGFLAIDEGFELSRHPGTVSKHDYPVFVIQPPKATADTGSGSTPPPKPGGPRPALGTHQARALN